MLNICLSFQSRKSPSGLQTVGKWGHLRIGAPCHNAQCTSYISIYLQILKTFWAIQPSACLFNHPLISYTTRQNWSQARHLTQNMPRLHRTSTTVGRTYYRPLMYWHAWWSAGVVKMLHLGKTNVGMILPIRLAGRYQIVKLKGIASWIMAEYKLVGI